MAWSKYTEDYEAYAFTAGAAFDYNYDPGSRPIASEPAFDPYADNAPEQQHYVESESWSYYPHNPYNRFAPPPPPPPAPKARLPTPPPAPTPEYLSTSLHPSTHLPSPSSSRKLLILDLNGTLVYRGPHVRARTAFQPYPDVDPKSGDRSHVPRLRTVHPRPYLPSFCAYIFHPHTKAWLDTMIWSSAQPHSVADMVERCFSVQKTGLVAVWARDTLGLNAHDYHRKAQTTKDLEKPWAVLGLRPGSNEEVEKEAEEAPQAHSARTTVLLDDSPLKAKLQPWNHICIREYVASMRQDDVACWESEERARERREEVAREVDGGGAADGTAEVKIQTNGANPAEGGEDGRHVADEVGGKNKRKRAKKKKNKVALISEDTSSSESFPTDRTRAPREPRPTYDPTLLAVIGVLDALKHESNIAGWIRAGRLRASATARDEENDIKSDNPVPSSPPPAILSAPYDDVRVTDGHPKRRRIEPLGTSAESAIDVDQLEEGKEGGSSEEAELGQWYEDASVMSYWVNRGLKALEELGEEVVSGVAT